MEELTPQCARKNCTPSKICGFYQTPVLHAEDGSDDFEDLRGIVKEKIKLYEVLTMQCDSIIPLDVWKRHERRFPQLADIASIASAPPAISGSSEIVFSSAGWVRETHRSCLVPENTEILVKLRHYLRLHGIPSRFDILPLNLVITLH